MSAGLGPVEDLQSVSQSDECFPFLSFEGTNHGPVVDRKR